MHAKTLLAACATAALLSAAAIAPAAAQTDNGNYYGNGYSRNNDNGGYYNNNENNNSYRGSEALQDARSQLRNARRTIERMERDPDARQLLREARAVFVVPNMTRGGFMIGGRGGEGVLMVRGRNGQWNGPSFYELGGVSFGWQVGVSHGAFVFALMTNRAVNHFLDNNNFSLNAGAGLSVVTYSANAQASWGKGDIVVWSNTAGAYVGATISGTDIHWDGKETRAFYRDGNITPQSAIWRASSPYRDPLEQALPG